MESESKIKRSGTLTLHLNYEEAMYIRDLTQNYLGAPNSDELFGDTVIRGTLFKHAFDFIDKIRGIQL